jgi:predicted amidohydrolase
MRICLIPLRTESRQSGSNSQQFIDRLEQLREQKPDLICLPECTFTGYLYCQEDFKRFAEYIPGPTTQEMARLARSYNVSLCFGMLELTEQGVYDAAILIDRSGAIVGMHRKIVEKLPFMNGNHVKSIDTDFGKMGILVCADLFDEEVIEQLDPGLRLLMVPMSRSFDGSSSDSRRWESEEREVYLEAVRKVGIPTALVNALETSSPDGSFGGAMIVQADGTLAAESPHGSDKVLVYDFE